MLSLNIPPWKLFRWFRRLQLWATGDWQLHHNNTPAHASGLMQSFLAKHQITQVTQTPYSPDLASWFFWLFPKLKSPLKGKRFQTIDEIQGKYDGAADGDWENSVRSQGVYFEGDWGIVVLCTMFLVSYIFFNKCLSLFFILHGWILSRQNLYNNLNPLELGISLGSS